jgi:Lrp/AsnC family leucine-responsive transcriptional regulator
MAELDDIDRKILTLLQQDSRMTMQEISDKVGLSPSPCHRRIKILEERGVITRYGATLDQRAVGLPVSVFVSIKLVRQKEEDLERFAKAVAGWREVLECYLMTGHRDYLLRVVVSPTSCPSAPCRPRLISCSSLRPLAKQAGPAFQGFSPMAQTCARLCADKMQPTS